MSEQPTPHETPESALAVDYAVDGYWLREWHGPATVRVSPHGIRVIADTASPTAHRLPGVLLPGFRDAHVHLGLTEPRALIAGGLAAVDDLGGHPERLQEWAADDTVPELHHAGAFITAPHTYPANRAWAATLAVAEVQTGEEAMAAVAQQLAAGATFVKVALNAEEGPVIDDDTLSALVEYAHSRGTEVVVHVQGTGQARRAFAAGADRLAHTPWTEKLSDSLIEEMAQPNSRFLAGRHSWISTLDIHGYGQRGRDFATASDNLQRFHAAGGIIRYGTDLGNGDLPPGLNRRELTALQDAGVRYDALLRALCLPGFGSTVSYLPTVPRADADLASWLMTATVVTARELLHPSFAEAAAAAHSARNSDDVVPAATTPIPTTWRIDL
ncbi:amidohydrolase family protein [Salinibacterium sp. SWN167]|uniref:amidohydrolase family protein n=1 Tax=Salinibacterium sp. SWN167 TaxID=2792054 RepID=UPI0018CFA063|nr:amidohydrolase family protein [Salinibacterium sp. SWN167]MBH0082352.1 amidohydrolase family protein [Salinibacterium sp. SWN167]